MKLLAGTHYDPAIAATKATSSLLAMTALDTTNLRLTFTVPSNGSVMVRMRGAVTGGTAMPQVLLGLLDHTNGDAVKIRSAAMCGRGAGSAGSENTISATFLVTGLTPGASLQYDAAYGVEIVVASSLIKLGGPDDSSAGTAGGGFGYEIWDTPGLLASAHYDPGTAATASVASLLAMTALDTTNLRVTFTAPSSGSVYVRLRGLVTGTTATTPGTQWGILDGATVRFRQKGFGGFGQSGTIAASDFINQEATGLVTGLTPGTSYTWDAAYSVDQVQASGVVSYGGPNNTTTNDAWGGFAFDVWNPDSLPRAIGSVA